MFKNREQAGVQLAGRLPEEFRTRSLALGADRIVVGLPRGGVIVGHQVASRLNLPLTLLVSKKISAPDLPELAIGAVSSAGVVALNDRLRYYMEHAPLYLEQEIRRLTAQTQLMEEEWFNAAGISRKANYEGKRVIVVDDGVATGMTARAALKSVKQLGASEVVLAVPVIAQDTKAALEKECDCVIALVAASSLGSVGQFYEDFSQVTDAEVIDALEDIALAKSHS